MKPEKTVVRDQTTQRLVRSSRGVNFLRRIANGVSKVTYVAGDVLSGIDLDIGRIRLTIEDGDGC
jgi:hypothetical protein